MTAVTVRGGDLPLTWIRPGEVIGPVEYQGQVKAAVDSKRVVVVEWHRPAEPLTAPVRPPVPAPVVVAAPPPADPPAAASDAPAAPRKRAPRRAARS